MKLVINIPCYNEQETLHLVLKELPKKIEGISTIEVQVVDDGSTDKTALIATQFKVNRIIKHKKNLGLGISFKDGMNAALEAGADIFVNTDADNQYPSRYIASLVKPILENKADIVIGNRVPWKVKHFSPAKRLFQYLGNIITRNIAGSNVPDTVSGFRAYSKEAMLRLNITTKFSYVLDTIMQASKKGLVIKSIQIETNAPTRRSRLFKNMFEHIKKSAINILRCYSVYEPFRTFILGSLVFFTPALILLARFLYYYFEGNGAGKIQSLIISAILFFLGGLMVSLGILGELIGTNRQLVEEQLYLKKKEIYKK